MILTCCMLCYNDMDSMMQAMNVPGFWQLQCAAVEAADAKSPMNDGQAIIEAGEL